MRIYFIFIFLFCSSIVIAQSIDSVYNFPIRPGTKEWGSLNSEDERFNSLQIPNNLLKKMSTECLIITCINYPLFGHFMIYDSKKESIHYLISRFNGLNELFSRIDAPLKMVNLYLQNDSTNMHMIEKRVDNSFWILRLSYFELLLAQDEILDKMDNKTMLSLIKESRHKLNNKIFKKTEYSIFSMQPTLWIIGKIINKLSMSEMLAQKKQIKTWTILLKMVLLLTLPHLKT